MSAILKTRTIAGHEVTLEVGRRYIATRPMAESGREWYDISIKDTDGNVVEMIPADYEMANVFLTEFNNGIVSTDGRLWR